MDASTGQKTPRDDAHSSIDIALCSSVLCVNLAEMQHLGELKVKPQHATPRQLWQHELKQKQQLIVVKTSEYASLAFIIILCYIINITHCNEQNKQA
jgi:hypothetical protein